MMPPHEACVPLSHVGEAAGVWGLVLNKYVARTSEGWVGGSEHRRRRKGGWVGGWVHVFWRA